MHFLAGAYSNLFFSFFFRGRIRYPTDMSQGDMELSECPQFFYFPSRRYSSFLGQVEHPYSILIFVPVLVEGPAVTR